MWFQNFFKPRNSTPTRRQPTRQRPPASRLRLEQLEDRTLPSNFAAATVADLIADINAANQQGGPNTITLVAPATSHYTLTAVDNTTLGATGLPVIAANDNLSIIGNGDTIERSTAAGTPAFRLLDVASGAALTLENLTLQGGWAYGAGGAIYSQGSLTLNGVTVQGNAAVGGDGISFGGLTPNAGDGGDGLGGGLYVAGGTLTMTSSSLSANKALGGNGGNGVNPYGAISYYGGPGGNGGNGAGGAVYVVAGTVNMTSDSLSANTAQGGLGGNGTDGINYSPYNGGNGGTGLGGAVYVVTGTVIVSSDTLSANTAQGGLGGNGGNSPTDPYDYYFGVPAANGGVGGSALGGGLYLAGGTVTLTSSTVSSNSAWAGTGGLGGNGYYSYGGNSGNGGSGLGGGLYVAGGTVPLTSDSVSSNSASAGAGGRGGFSFNGPPGLNGSPGLGKGGGLYIAPSAAVRLDSFTLQHVQNNTASTSYPDIFGSYSLAPGFAVTGFPSTTTAGAPGAFTVTAIDANNATDTNYTGTVHFTSSDGQAALPADYTFTAADAGVHTFSAILSTAGRQSITAMDTAGTTGMDAGITVNPAAASQFIIGAPASSTAGSAFSVTVTARDPYNNTATSYASTVHFTSTDGLAMLPGNYTFTAADAGVHAFTGVILNTTGSQTITATDMVTSSITGGAAVAVNPAPASTMILTGFPSPTTAGVAGSFTVTAKYADGSIDTGYTGTVHFSSTDGQAGLPADYTFTAADGGVHTFSATLKTAGTQSITATDSQTSGLTGSDGGIMVNAAAASTMTVAGFPSSTTAGAAGTITVTLKDAYGNIASGYAGTVHFTSSDTKAALPANYTFTAADAGVHSFSVTLKTAGTQSLTAADTVNSALTSTESGITVNAAAASKFIITAPSTVTAGAPFSLTITVEDAYGNVVTGYTGTIHFTSTDNKATLPANYTFTAADKGVHTFTGLILRKKGKQTITITDALNSSLTGSVIENVL